MPNVQHKRGTRAALVALAAGGGLLPGQVYVLTDEDRIAVATGISTFETFAKQSEAAQPGARLFLRPLPGGFVDNALNATANGTQVQVAGRAVIAPLPPAARDLTIDQVGVSVSTAVAAAQIKVVIFDADADGRPTSVLAESGVIDAGTTGTKMVPLAFTFETGKIYWIGVRSDSTATLRALNVAAAASLSTTNAATPVRHVTLLRTGETFADPAAAWTFSNAQLSNILPALIIMRVA